MNPEERRGQSKPAADPRLGMTKKRMARIHFGGVAEISIAA